MLNMLKKKNAPEEMLKHFLFFALFFPMCTSSYDSPYAPDWILANVFTTLFLCTVLIQKRITWRKQSPLVYVLVALLVLYNAAALVANKMQLSWYSSQINITLSFLTFLGLICLEKDGLGETDDVIRFFLQAVILSNAIGLVPYFLDDYGIRFMNGQCWIQPMDPNYYERRYNWIYLHKSQYAFMLILFLALIVTYRRLFRNRWTYWGTIAVMAVGLVISNTMTSIFAALFIFIGMLGDRIFRKDGHFQPKRLLWLIPVALVLAFGVYLIAQKRNIFTLGTRTYIWKAGLSILRENPYGVGRMAGTSTYPVPIPGSESPYMVTNLHNVFLNLMLQFSPMAGLMIIGMLAAIAGASLKRNLSFRTLGIWVALLLPMMMDWCILLTEFPLVLVGLYYIFFSPRRDQKTEAATDMVS